MGGGGSACGALVGAVMAVGLKHGRAEGSGDAQAARERSQRVLRRFVAEMGSDLCRELTGMDLSTPEGTAAFRQSDVPERVCRRAIATGARLAEAELSAEPSH
jgi:C_GCAxxG_C_C family probable redox protein